jgi:hypothetical protein
VLQNPLIAAAEHLIDVEGVRRAAGAVVVKLANEFQAANYRHRSSAAS